MISLSLIYYVLSLSFISDSVLVSYKSFKQEDFNHIQASLINYMTSGVSKKGLNWQVEVAPCPIYLLGRYIFM